MSHTEFPQWMSRREFAGTLTGEKARLAWRMANLFGALADSLDKDGPMRALRYHWRLMEREFRPVRNPSPRELACWPYKPLEREDGP